MAILFKIAIVSKGNYKSDGPVSTWVQWGTVFLAVVGIFGRKEAVY